MDDGVGGGLDGVVVVAVVVVEWVVVRFDVAGGVEGEEGGLREW